jgi:RHS repeat-associated protein
MLIAMALSSAPAGAANTGAADEESESAIADHKRDVPKRAGKDAFSVTSMVKDDRRSTSSNLTAKEKRDAAVATRRSLEAAGAAAAEGATVLTFDDGPSGTRVTDRYRGQGIVFGSPNTTEPPFLTTDGSNPTSPVLSGYPQFSGDIMGWFVIPGTNKPTSVSSFTLDVGFIDTPDSIQVIAYTTGGADIVSASTVGINTITSNVGNIVAFEVMQSASEPAGFAIDNVTFVPGTTTIPGLAGGLPSPSETNGGSNPGSQLIVCGIRLCGDPVNTLTGNLTETFTDVAVTGAGVGVTFNRTYNSDESARDGWFGRGWRATWESSVRVDGTSATITFDNGSTVLFNETSLGWVAAPRVTADFQTFPDGTSEVELVDGTNMKFAADGSLFRVTEANGRAVSLDRVGDTLVASDAAGRSTTLEFDANGHVTKVIDPMGSETTYSYDAEHLAKVVSPLGGTTTFGYTGDRLTKLVDAVGGTVEHSYNDEGRVVAQVDKRGGTWAYDYALVPAATEGDLEVLTVSVTAPDGNVTRQRYENRLLVSETAAFGTAQAATWSFAYDALVGGRISETRPDGEVVLRSFDSRGNVTSQTDPEGRVSMYTYDLFGNRTSVTYPSGRVDTADYDLAGNLSALTEDYWGVALSTWYVRDGLGNLVGTYSPSGSYTSFETNAAGLPVEITDPDGKRLTIEYDALGREVSRTQVAMSEGVDNRVTTKTWDAESRLTSQTDPTGAVVSATFDAAGRPLTSTDAQGNVTTTAYNAPGDVIKVTSATGSAATFTYDAMGRLLTRTQRGGTTRYEYDRLGQRTVMTDPLGRATSRTFDAAGRVRTSTSPDGTTVTNAYDASGLQTAIEYSDATPDVTYSYDADGQRTGMQDASGATTYVYDGAGRLTSYTNAVAGAVTYELDPDDNATRITYPGGRDVIRAYSSGGRLLEVIDWNNQVTQFSIDSFGQTSRVSYPNGVAAAWSFDQAGSPTDVNYDLGGTTIASYTAELEVGGLIRSATALATSLTGAETQTFDYNPSNQLASVNGTEVAYDAEANLLQRPDGLLQRFDAAGQLVEIEGATAPTTPTPTPTPLPTGTPTPTDASAGKPPTVVSTVTKTVKSGVKRVRFPKVSLAPGSKLVALVSAGRAIAGKPVGGSRLTVAGLAVTRGGYAVSRAGRVDSWVGSTASARVVTPVVRLGKRHGVTQVTVVRVDGATSSRVVKGQGKTSKASVALTTTAKQQLVLVGVAATTRKSRKLAPASGNIALASSARQKSKKFATLATRTTTTGARSLRVGSATKATWWSVGGLTFTSTAGAARAAKTTPGADGANATTNAPSAGQIVSVQYSANGERIAEGPDVTYSYDAERRLTRLTKPGVSQAFTYDGDGLRLTSSGTGGPRTFTYDVASSSAPLLSDGVHAFIYGPGDVPIAQVAADGTTSYLLGDTQGNVRAVASADGSLAGAANYEATGVRTVVGASTPLGFHGQYTDLSGLQYLRARYYDAETAAFLTPDPMREATGSPYGFAGGNPISFADPTGLVFVSCAAILAGSNTLNGVIGDAAQGYAGGLKMRATLLGQALRTSPSAAVRSYAASQLRSAGTALKSPVFNTLTKLGSRLPLVGAGLTYGTHVLEGDSQAESLGSAGGAFAGGLAGGAAGGALGGVACGALAGVTFGAGAASCPFLVGGGALVGGVAGGFVGEWVGGHVGGFIGGLF